MARARTGRRTGNVLVQKEDLFTASTSPCFETLTAHTFTTGRQGQIEELASHFLYNKRGDEPSAKLR
jgi:hypothetical protein